MEIKVKRIRPPSYIYIYIYIYIYMRVCVCVCVCVCLNVIIIVLRCQHGSPWPSLATRLYRQLLPGGLQGYILYRHRAVVYRFLQVVLAFVHPYDGVHWSILLMSSSLLLQQCPACLVRLTWIVFVMGSRWQHSSCFAGSCLQDLFSIDRSILM